MTRKKTLLLIAISTITLEASCLASSNYTLVTETEDTIPGSRSITTNSDFSFVETMVPPPVSVVPSSTPVYEPHGTLNPHYQLKATPIEILDPLVVIDRSSPQQPSQALPYGISYPPKKALSHGVTPPPVGNRALPYGVSFPPNYKPASSFEYGITPPPIRDRALPYGVSFPPNYKPASSFEYGITPPPIRDRALPYGVSFPPNYKPALSFEYGVTPPPTKKLVSSELSADATQQQAQQSHVMVKENMLSKLVKRQAAREAYASTRDGYYLSSTHQKVTLAQPGQPKPYSYQELSQDDIPSLYRTNIEYTQESTQEAAIRLATRAGTKIGALNYGNGTFIGGSAFNGANGQEESFIRTSTLFSSLSQLVAPQIDLEKEITKAHTEIRYNLETNKALTKYSGVLISPNVSIFRRFNAQTTRYENLDTPTIVTVLTSVALNLNHGRPKDYAEITRQKIYSQLAAFAKEGLDSIILGAWGCGAFGNKVEDIAPIYRSLLENEFKDAFKTVVFAIPGFNDLTTFRSTLEAKKS